MNVADHDQPGDSGVGLALGSAPESADEPAASAVVSDVRASAPDGYRDGGGSAGDRDAADSAADRAASRWVSAAVRHPVTLHLALLVGYVGAGVLVNWPHGSYLAGRIPATRDAGSYVWGFWWMARSVEHLSNPWSTTYLAAPVGTQLGLHTLMPLAGVVMLPVTVLFGPSASYNLLSIALPGLLGYAMYRVARLWIPSQIGAIAAGAFFGFSTRLDYQAWVHLNLAAGALFLPLALEAAVRLRRRPGPRQVAILGVVLGASVLVDQESAVLATMLVVAALLPWLLSRPAPPDPADTSIAARVLSAPRWARLLPAGLAAVIAAVVATPALIAAARAAGGPTAIPTLDYLAGIRLPDMFEPSPRVSDFGLPVPTAVSTFGVVLSALTIAGLVLAWRRLNAWLLLLLWLGAAALALGPVLYVGSHTYVPVAQMWHGIRISSVLPYSWFVRIPGLVGFKEPTRIAELGLVPAALLAGYAVHWLRNHAAPVMVVVLVAAFMEAGLSTPPGATTMPTALPALDRPIAADHSGSIVVDVPFGIRGGLGIVGTPFAPETEVLATADGHRLANAYLARVPPATVTGIFRQPFYYDLMSAQIGRYQFSAAQLTAAAQNARQIDVGWVLLWTADRHMRQFLLATGFRFDYRADKVWVYRAEWVHRPSQSR